MVGYGDSGFDAVYRAHFDAISRYCLRRLPIEDARDATTEVFTAAWRRFDSVDQDRDVLPWLYAVARNVVRNRARSSRRHLRLVTKIGAQPPRFATDPADQVVLGEPAASVGLALRTLSEADQEIIRLRSFEDLSLSQVSLVLGCSLDAAKKRSSRALERLRTALADVGVDHRATRKEERA